MDGLQATVETLDERDLHVVCLPDFFLDHFVELPELGQAHQRMQTVHDRGGGNLPAHQRLAPGGNAANTAYALARLGVNASLITRTSRLGFDVLTRTLGEAGVDLEHVRGDGALALTVALEHGPERTNVMLNEPAGVAEFGPADLGPDARRAIQEADAVLVANWKSTREQGTELAREVCRLADAAGTLSYLDPSDPTERAEAVPDLLDVVVTDGILDVLAVNEHELSVLAGSGPTEEVGAGLAEAMAGTLDVHSHTHAWTWGADGHTQAPGFQVPRRQSTGAGDAWNAGNLVGHLLGLDPIERLRLAHAVAGFHVSSPTHVPATAEELVAFLDHHPPQPSTGSA